MDITAELLRSLRTDRKAFEARCESIAALLERNDLAVETALVRIYDRQTADEKSCLETLHDNGIGFQACDAKTGSYYAGLVKRGFHLFADRLPRARKMAVKYRRQLAVLSFEKDLAKRDADLERMAAIEAEEYKREARKEAMIDHDVEPNSGMIESHTCPRCRTYTCPDGCCCAC